MLTVSDADKNQRSNSRNRDGFSLVEILVVIAIIAFLLAIVVGALGYVSRTSKETATKSTIKLISEILGQRRAAFDREITDQDKEAGSGVPQYAIGFMGQAGNDKELAKVLGKKNLFRRHFPQIYSESSEISSPGGTHEPTTESAELLYFMLTKGATTGAKSVDTDAFKSDQIADTDGDGNFEFIDGWGHPLRFYRWPTRLLRTAGGTGGFVLSPESKLLMRGIPATHAADPDDPFGSASSVTGFEESYHSPDTYHTPLIVSMGADETLGLHEPNDSTHFGNLAQPISGQIDALTDNITNLNTSGGGE